MIGMTSGRSVGHMSTNDIPEAVDAYLASLDADDEDTLRIIATDLAYQKQYVQAVPATLGGVAMDDGRADALRDVFHHELREMAKKNSAGWRALLKYLDVSG